MSLIQDSFQIDWLFVSASSSAVIFFLTCTMIFYRIWRLKPELLKGMEEKEADYRTTYNWNLILSVVGNCIGLSGGVFVIMNVVFFLLFDIWYIDARSVIILVAAFAIVLFRSFDRFCTKTFTI